MLQRHRPGHYVSYQHENTHHTLRPLAEPCSLPGHLSNTKSQPAEHPISALRHPELPQENHNRFGVHRGGASVPSRVFRRRNGIVQLYRPVGYFVDLDRKIFGGHQRFPKDPADHGPKPNANRWLPKPEEPVQLRYVSARSGPGLDVRGEVHGSYDRSRRRGKNGWELCQR